MYVDLSINLEITIQREQFYVIVSLDALGAHTL